MIFDYNYFYVFMANYIYILISGFYMKPKQNTLTDAELLILLEGDVSDVDLDMSDDELSWALSATEMNTLSPQYRGSRTGPGNDRSAEGGRRRFG